MPAKVKDSISKSYQYGFVTDIESETAPKGLNEDTIRFNQNFLKNPLNRDKAERLEKKDDVDLQASKKDYQRLLTLNNYIDGLFKERIKKIRFTGKKK